MSEAHFTPGPWVCDPPEAFGPANDACVWEAESGGPICYVGDAYPRGSNHPLENMRLIAAAPDMFAALQYNLNACCGDCEACRRATAAIAKATEPIA